MSKVLILALATVLLVCLTVKHASAQVQLDPVSVSAGLDSDNIDQAQETILSGSKQAVKVWDNHMIYMGYMVGSMSDASQDYEIRLADDFEFTENTKVSEVRWYGGYYGTPPTDGDFNMMITFYEDYGDGNKPGTQIWGHYFMNSEVNETYLTTWGDFYYYSYVTILPEDVSFDANTKYWVSIVASGQIPPQFGMSSHTTANMHECVLKSEYFGYPDWANSSTMWGISFELAFELWGEVVTTCCINPGDANHDTNVNLLDITYLIGFLYNEDPAPICMYEGDANADCNVNILDITYLINHLYRFQPAPTCAEECPDW